MSSSSEVLGDAAIASASDAQHQEQHPHLRAADVGLSNKRAQLRGTALGVSLGLVSMLVLGRSGRVSANAAVLAGMGEWWTSGTNSAMSLTSASSDGLGGWLHCDEGQSS